MIKAIELIVVLILLIFSFFAGVKYSDPVKKHASWIFETKEDDIELPDLSNENENEPQAIIDENGQINTNPAPIDNPQSLEHLPLNNMENNLPPESQPINGIQRPISGNSH